MSHVASPPASGVRRGGGGSGLGGSGAQATLTSLSSPTSQLRSGARSDADCAMCLDIGTSAGRGKVPGCLPSAAAKHASDRFGCHSRADCERHKRTRRRGELGGNKGGRRSCSSVGAAASSATAQERLTAECTLCRRVRPSDRASLGCGARAWRFYPGRAGLLHLNTSRGVSCIPDYANTYRYIRHAFHRVDPPRAHG